MYKSQLKALIHSAVVLVFLFPISGFAGDKPLTKELVSSAFNAMEAITQLADKHPEWEDLDEEEKNESFFTEEAIKKMVVKLKQKNAYKPVLSAVKKQGFKSIEEGYSIFSRSILTGMHSQMGGNGTYFKNLIPTMEAQIKQLKDSKVPAELLKEQEDNLVQLKTMAAAIEGLSEQDKAFGKKNSAWIMSKMSAMDDGEQAE